MGKKHRRNVTRMSDMATPSVPATPGGISSAAPERSGRGPGFSPDYTYVFKDLKRIGFLAGTFIFLLILGSFFVR